MLLLPFLLAAGEIPAIIYDVQPTDGNFKFVRSLGFNTVHTYGGGRSTPEAIEKDMKFLELAQANGLKVMYNLNGKGWTRIENYESEFRAYIRKFKNHPAISMWYLYDEPKIGEVPKLRRLYRILKDETPDIPVGIAMNWTEDFMRYADIYDVILPDIYTVADQEFPAVQLDQLPMFTAQLQTLGKPVIPIGQFFRLSQFPDIARTRTDNPENCRYPNAIELRYWVYSSAVQECEGIAFYSFYRGVAKEKDGRKWAAEVFGPVLNEYMKWAGAGFIRRQELTRLRDTHMRGMIARTVEGEFLVLVNDWPLEQRVYKRYMNDLIGEAVLEPVGPTRKVNAVIADGRLSIDEKIQPWETLVWKITRKIQE